MSPPSAAVAADLPDLNVWLALAWPGHPHHGRAAAYWEQMASSQVLFCTVTVLGLLRLLSQSKVMGRACLTLPAASDVLRGFTSQPGVAVVDGGVAAMDVLHSLLERQDLASKDITDAHLAALAIAHGWRLVTFDRGFGRFDGLVWLEP